ncbi:MAG: hypothetical protein LBU22_13240 [Dysgonamonadaceae bacterium]|jgi:hypothetical protein|nr:hypothetical protein [Dysgonamonadaceae bacterium]
MTDAEKDLLRRIPSMRMEAKVMLRVVSLLAREKKEIYNKEIDKWLDRLDWLDKLEEELKNKK